MSTLPLPIAAFLAGLVSFLSPCVLPLVPGYVSLISGAGVEELKAPESRLFSKVMLNSIGFILGFSVVFITLGAISTEVGQLLARYKSTAGAGRRRGHYPVWAAPDRPVQDQGAVHRRAPAPGKGRQHAMGSLRDRLCFRLRLDALRGSDPGRDPHLCRCSGFGDQGDSSCWRFTRWGWRYRSC